MGAIIYGGTGTVIELDDRTLAHLQAVVATKLRRGEGFFFNWLRPAEGGDVPSACWIGPNVPLVFEYSGPKPPELNRHWLETMTMGANSNGGLYIGEEPPPNTDPALPLG